jgi:hypothetical protein
MEWEHAGVVVTPADFRGLDWVERCADLGMRTLGIHNGGGRGEDALARLGDTATTAFRDRAERVGLEVEYELHVGSSLLPRALFATHPEWFAYRADAGTRTPDANFCPSHPEALATACANARTLAQALCPTTHRHFFWSDDGMPWCQCDACAKLSDSDQELLVANAIARTLRADDPSAKVAYLAYDRTLDPPRHVRPEPGVFLEFAPIRRRLDRPLDGSACETNATHCRQLRELLRMFSPATAHVLEYWLDSSLASNWRRPVQAAAYDDHVVARDLSFYHALGIRSITTFAVYIDGAYVQKYGEDSLLLYSQHIRQARGMA